MRKFLTREKFKKSAGFSIIEVLVYSICLVLIVNVLVLMVFQLISLNQTSKRNRESISNARRAIEAIAQEIRHAQSTYTPTSVFGSNPGQLSLETTRDLPADENSTYADFYVDDYGLYLKKEGKTAQLLTSEKVKVTNLVFTNLTGSVNKPAIQIKITVEYKEPISGSKNAVSLETTASLRSY